MLADVAETGGAEQRVGDGMGDGVGVAVAVQAADAFEHDTAEHQRSARVVAEAVDVESLADANGVHRASLSARSRAQARSSRWVILRLVSSPATTTTRPPQSSTSAASSVASRSPACAARKHRRPERLRGLHGDERGPRRRLDDHVVGVDPLDRVGHRHAWDRPVGAVGDGRDHGREQSRRRERTGGVVHADDGRVERHCRQTGTHRLAPCRPAGHATLGFDIARRHHQDDAVADGSGGLDGMVDDPPRADLLVLLGAAEP